MGTLYITEFASPGVAHGGVVPVGNAGGWRDQTPVTFTATSTVSAAFGTNTTLVRVQPDATCSITIGVTAVASTNTARMVQNQTEYYTVQAGQVLAVIANV